MRRGVFHRLWLLMLCYSVIANRPLLADGPISPPFQSWQFIDLTHDLDEKSPVYPGGIPFKLSNVLAIENGFYFNKFEMSEHCGTHVDAPSHKSANGEHVSNLTIEQLTGPLIVIDVRKDVFEDPDFGISSQRIRDFERCHGMIPPRSFVVANTGWAERWNDPTRYVNIGDDGLPHFPGFTADAATYLATERNAIGMGIDTLSTDIGTSKDFPQHRVFLESGGINIENLTNLETLPPTGAYLMVAPLKIARGSGGPARVFALVSKRELSGDTSGKKL